MRGGSCRRWFRRGLSLLALVAFQLALLELGLWAATSLGLLDIQRPPYRGTGFWDGDHPVLGVWHAPDSRFVHVSGCFQVAYRSNSVGARDRERSLESDRPRVVVLGDSFVEGWGVRARQRLSNRLEQATGMEHLNFGMAHFGPYQQALVYRELARRYSHSAVISVVYPRNDFLDLDSSLPDWAADAVNYEYRYRPYLVPDDGGFRHVDLREPRLRRLLRRYTYTFHAWNALRRRLHPSGVTEVPLSFRREPPILGSPFYDFTERDLSLLEASLDLLASEAADKVLVVVLVPDITDLQRYHRDGADPLARRLAPFATRTGAHVIDLLPLMHDATRDWKSYFHTCDFHWSPHGNEVAAEILLRQLDGVLYGGALGDGPAGAPPDPRQE